MAEIVISLVVACLGSSGFTAIILAILQRRWAKADSEDDKMDAVINGIKVLTVDRVRYLGQRYIAAKSISLEDKENLHDMYRAYKGLGGNGHLETIMAEVDQLPVTSR